MYFGKYLQVFLSSYVEIDQVVFDKNTEVFDKNTEGEVRCGAGRRVARHERKEARVRHAGGPERRGVLSRASATRKGTGTWKDVARRAERRRLWGWQALSAEGGRLRRGGTHQHTLGALVAHTSTL